MTAKCGNCQYFMRPPLITNQEGSCRRYPPSTQYLSTPKGAMQLTFRPVVKTTEWCGEHKRTVLNEQGGLALDRNDPNRMHTTECAKVKAADRHAAADCDCAGNGTIMIATLKSEDFPHG